MSDDARSQTALIVDDDVGFATPLVDYLADQRITATLATSLADARRAYAERPPDFLLVDLILPDGSGLELIRELPADSDAVVVLITGHPSVESAVGALRERVDEYLVKPLRLEDVSRCLGRLRDRAGEAPAASPSNARSGDPVCRHADGLGELLGQSDSMLALFDQIERVAATDATVLIQGETGSGKELVAQAIHALSGQPGGLVALNCGAIPVNLVGSELFGHEKGSFTGATRRRIGAFERAADGTLFLDEITEMPQELQVNFLRVLETNQVYRVGGSEPIRVDTRLVAATNREAADAVASGLLREDLFFRLNVFPLQVPPLRERGSDVTLLASHFLDALNTQYGEARAFDAEALKALEIYAWPGNVRELRHAVHRAFIMADGGVIGPDSLPDARTPIGRSRTDDSSLTPGMSIEEAERRLIEVTLERLDGDKKRAADLLGVSLKTLYNRLNRYAAEND